MSSRAQALRMFVYVSAEPLVGTSNYLFHQASTWAIAKQRTSGRARAREKQSYMYSDATDMSDYFVNDQSNH